MISEKNKIDYYQNQLFNILNSSCVLDNTIIENTKKLIINLRNSIIAKTVEVNSRCRSGGGTEPEWGPYWISRLLQEYNNEIKMVSEKFRQDLTEYSIKSYDIGMNLADLGLEVSLPGSSSNIDKPNLEQAKLASTFPGDLITGMEEKQLTAISRHLSISMSRGESAGMFMARLSKKISSGPWSDTYYRAEVIARTETARIQELSRMQRTFQQNKIFPGVKLYSQFICEPRGIYPCKKCASYDGNVYETITGKLFRKAPGKVDENMPILPIHPNCLCMLIPYIPGVSRNIEEKVEEQSERKNFSEIKWDDGLNMWSMTLPNGMGMRTITILPRTASFDELKEEGNRILTGAGLNVNNIFTEITRPTDMVGPDDLSDSPKKRRAIADVLGKLMKDLAPGAKRPSEED